MNKIICEESFTLGRAASNWCQEKIKSYGARSLFIPAGQTPVSLYKLWEQERPEYLKNMSLLQIDEVLTGQQKGVFRDFFKSHLPSYQKQIQTIDQAETVADLAVLGLGVNGHVAFHEPGIDSRFFSGCIQLTPKTCEYLSLEKGTWGLSYGVSAFLRCKAILITVSGPKKRDILRQLLSENRELPATHLLRHPDLTLLLDREAYPTESLRQK